MNPLTVVEDYVDLIHKISWTHPRTGIKANGWNERIKLYSYATSKHANWADDFRRTIPFFRKAKRLAKNFGSWTASDSDNAILLTEAIFGWGGVSTVPTLKNIKLVFDATLTGSSNNAPMNSSWTKLAAFASHHLGVNGEHIIHDSRVAWAIIKNLDTILCNDIDRARLFPKLGYIVGQAGTRPRNAKHGLKLEWPNAYGKWESQYAASDFARSIVNVLNTNGSYPRMPTPEGKEKNWTVWGVGQVLFMEGY